MLNKISKTYYPGSQRVFSRPSFKIFSSFIISFIQLGKETHTSSMVQSLTHPFFTDLFPASPDSWDKTSGPWRRSPRPLWISSSITLRIKADSFSFLSWMTPSLKKTGKKIPGCAWHKDHAQNMANVFGHQWVLSALLYKDFLLPLWAKLYHPKGTKGCGPFQTKITLAKKMHPRRFDSLSPVKSIFWQIVGIGRKHWLKSVESVVTI